jgi:hypothetical protein
MKPVKEGQGPVWAVTPLIRYFYKPGNVAQALLVTFFSSALQMRQSASDYHVADVMLNFILTV